MRAIFLVLGLPLLGESALERQIAEIAKQSGGVLGVASVELKSGRTVTVRAQEKFPMASVFKLPVALTILDSKAGAALDRKIALNASDARPFRSPVAPLVSRGGTFTVQELLDAMLIESDNTAADVLLRFCGGGSGVTAHLRSLGVAGIRVDRSEGEMALDYAGVTEVLPQDRWTLEWFKSAMAAVPREQQRVAAERFLADERDTTTPEAMIRLLKVLAEGKALSKDRTEMVLDRMRRTVPAAGRIKAGLPPGTAVAHRPGSGGENEGVTLCTNDVGIVELPGGGQMLVAIFLKGSNQDDASRQRTIARVTRTIFDAWTR